MFVYHVGNGGGGGVGGEERFFSPHGSREVKKTVGETSILLPSSRPWPTGLKNHTLKDLPPSSSTKLRIKPHVSLWKASTVHSIGRCDSKLCSPDG